MLERALRVFWRHGYEATSIAALTAAMDIRPPSLYAAFGDKRRLFGAVVERYGQGPGAFAARALAEEPAAYPAMSRVLYEAAGHYTDPGHPPGCMIISAATNCTPASQDVRAELLALREGQRQAFQAKIADDVSAGRLPAWVDAAALATFYAAVLQGMSTQAADGASRTDLEAIAAYALSAWPSGELSTESRSSRRSSLVADSKGA